MSRRIAGAAAFALLVTAGAVTAAHVGDAPPSADESPMAGLVQQSVGRLTPTDLHPVAAYLAQAPARPGDIAVARDTPGARIDGLYAPSRERAGQAIYAGVCAGCHGEGGPAPAVGAGLTGHRSVNDPSGANVIAVILHGIQGSTPRGRTIMPAFGHAYSDAEIAEVTRYVIAAFGPGHSTVTAVDVARARQQ